MGETYHQIAAYLWSPFGQKILIILLVISVGFSIPIWYWKLPPFAAIRQRITSLGKCVVQTTYSGCINKFQTAADDNFKVTGFVRLTELEGKVVSELRDLTNTILFFMLMQFMATYALWILTANHPDLKSAEIAIRAENMLSVPFPELIFLYMFYMNTTKFIGEWKKLEYETT